MFIEAFCNYLFLLPLYIVIELLICRAYKRRGVELGRGFVIGWQLLVCLLTAVFSITGLASLEEALRFINIGGPPLGSEQINLIPIVRWGLEDPIGLGLNVFMFVPVGMALPMLWRSAERFWTTLASGFCLSLLIELSQLFNARVTDIDDLITNTLGAALGWLLYRLLLKKVKLFKVGDAGKNGALATVAAVFAMYFLIGGSIVMHTWIAIYS